MRVPICAFGIAVATALSTLPALAQAPRPAAREVSARSLPVPETVSPELQKIIGAPLSPVWNVIPPTNDEWKKQIKGIQDALVQTLPALRDALKVKVEPATFDGVKAHIVAPETIPPENRNRLLIHVHGGCYASFAGESGTAEAIYMAGFGKFKIISVDYRTPPDHPYPAALDDCEAAALWLLSERGRDAVGAPGPLAIGGDSAGGHLAACSLLRLRDRHGITGAFGAAVFQYGAFDLSMTPSQRLWGERNLVLSTPIITWFADQFLPVVDQEQRRDPDISPLYAELSEMPPAVFTIGTADPLLDDSLFMEARWRAAGHPTELRVWEQAPHGFLSLPMAVSDVALTAEHDFLVRTLGLG